MTVDCRWIEKNLEPLYCDRLSEEEIRRARMHIQTCIACRKETQALEAVDPLIKGYFQRQMYTARAARGVHKGRILGLAGSVAAVVVLLVVILGRSPVSTPAALSVAESTPPPAADPAAPPQPTKIEPPIERSKPTFDPANPADRKPPAPVAVTANSPEFLVTDPIGYSHGLEEFRGRTVVVGLWTANAQDTIDNLERLYKANSSNPNFRLIAVSVDRKPRPANTTFPVFYNQGSKLFGAQAGEFVLINESGSTELRGSLAKDYDELTKTLRTK
jgi:hypothetical protein